MLIINWQFEECLEFEEFREFEKFEKFEEFGVSEDLRC